MECINEQFRKDDEQMMPVDLHGQFITHLAVEVHFYGVRNQTTGIFKCFACQIITNHRFVRTDGLTSLNQRSDEQFAHHIVECIGLHIHRLSHFLLLFIRN